LTLSKQKIIIRAELSFFCDIRFFVTKELKLQNIFTLSESG